MGDIGSDLLNLLDAIDALHAEAATDFATARSLFEPLDAAVDEVQESWSGSWAGYHATLYFRDFHRPDRGSRFSVEWGAVHGLPDGWSERTEAEVQHHVETASGVSISELENLSVAVYDRVRPLYQEAQALVTPILERSGDSSRALLEELRGELWGTAAATYLNHVRPAQATTYDTDAAFQGFKTPPHVSVRARAVAAYSRIAAAVTALERAKTAVRQAQAALAVSSIRRENSRWSKWLVVALIAALAVESFVLARPPVLSWFNSTFSQEFLTAPTRFGFTWGDIIANTLAAMIFAPFALVGQRIWRWLAGS